MASNIPMIMIVIINNNIYFIQHSRYLAFVNLSLQSTQQYRLAGSSISTNCESFSMYVCWIHMLAPQPSNIWKHRPASFILLSHWTYASLLQFFISHLTVLPIELFTVVWFKYGFLSTYILRSCIM